MPLSPEFHHELAAYAAAPHTPSVFPCMLGEICGRYYRLLDRRDAGEDASLIDTEMKGVVADIKEAGAALIQARQCDYAGSVLLTLAPHGEAGNWHKTHLMYLMSRFRTLLPKWDELDPDGVPENMSHEEPCDLEAVPV